MPKDKKKSRKQADTEPDDAYDAYDAYDSYDDDVDNPQKILLPRNTGDRDLVLECARVVRRECL